MIKVIKPIAHKSEVIPKRSFKVIIVPVIKNNIPANGEPINLYLQYNINVPIINEINKGLFIKMVKIYSSLFKILSASFFPLSE